MQHAICKNCDEQCSYDHNCLKRANNIENILEIGECNICCQKTEIKKLKCCNETKNICKKCYQKITKCCPFCTQNMSIA